MNDTPYTSGNLLEFLRKADPRFDRTRLEAWHRCGVFETEVRTEGGQRRFSRIDLVAARAALLLMTVVGSFETREVIACIRRGGLENHLLLLTSADAFNQSVELFWLPSERTNEIGDLIIARGNDVVVVPICTYFEQADAFIAAIGKKNVSEGKLEAAEAVAVE